MGKKQHTGSRSLHLRSLAAVSAILLMVTGLILGASLIRRSIAEHDALQTMSREIYSGSIRPHIVLDPGHGGMDGGAIGCDGSVEKEINLEISLLLRDLLGTFGYDVTMIRMDDTDLGGGSGTVREQKKADLAARLEIMEQDPGAAVLMIHQNQFTQSKYHGAQMFYGLKDTSSKLLAENLRGSIIDLVQPDNTREIKPATDDVWLLMQCTNPIVLVECGFLSNPEECALLQDSAYQQQMAFAIAAGTAAAVSSK